MLILKGFVISAFLIPAAPIHIELEIKKSRFIAYLDHTPGTEAAKNFIEEIKNKHSDARHNCWGFVAGAPNDAMQLGFSDDGEPSGTAGKPILAQLKGSDLGEVTAVVTRYFGGVKLGTGGLVKAYGGAVQQALSQLSTVSKTPQRTVHIEFDYPHQGAVEHLLSLFSAQIVEQHFGARAKLTLSLDIDVITEFCTQLANATRGQVTVTTPD